MEQNPWEADRFSARQEIPRILWHPKVHYRNYKCPYTEIIISLNKNYLCGEVVLFS